LSFSDIVLAINAQKSHLFPGNTSYYAADIHMVEI